MTPPPPPPDDLDYSEPSREELSCHRGPVQVPGCPLIWRGTYWQCDDPDHYVSDGSGHDPTTRAVPPPDFMPPPTYWSDQLASRVTVPEDDPDDNG